jgi:DNA-binding PadR family transcriptional regulator
LSLKHILLGLAERECSGYDIKKEFDTSLRNFWRAELSQIYPQLQKLKTDGLLTSDTAESGQGPQRIVYHRTGAGKAMLKDWLEAGPVVGTERIAFLAQVYFLHELDSDDARLEFLGALRAYFVERLAFLDSVEQGWAAKYPGYPDDMPDDEFYPQLTLACGKHRIGATVAWCDETIARIKKRATA